MIAMTSLIARNEHVETADLRVHMNVDWQGFETLLALRGERHRPRMAYLDGVVELMTTSFDHERINGILRFLIGAYMVELGIVFGSYGEWTLKAATEEAGVEADECFQIGPDQSRDRWPDLAIEVVWTHGDMNKLEIYRRLGVLEVWIWEDGKITVHALVGDRYRSQPTSTLLPQLDLALITRLVQTSASTSEAVVALRLALKKP